MINLALNFLAAVLVLMCMVALVPNVALENLFNFGLSVLVVGLINFLLRPMLLIIRGTINPMELCGFALVLNLLVLNVAGGLIDDFDLAAFSAAIFGAVLLSVAQILIDRYESNRGKLIS